MAKLYVVATPIGNLLDISLRALRILKEADLVLCEDTRTTRKLLEHYKILKPTISYHQHSRLSKVNYILEELKRGKNLALVSDAGTPGISDPGNKLIQEIVKELGDQAEIISVPGPSAIAAALSVSGFSANKFTFFGFPPAKKKRNKFFEEVAHSKHTSVFYESPHRIIKTLNELNLMFQVSRRRQSGYGASATSFRFQVVVCRELTKKFEIIYRGDIEETINRLKEDKIRGEFVVIVGSPAKAML